MKNPMQLLVLFLVGVAVVLGIVILTGSKQKGGNNESSVNPTSSYTTPPSDGTNPPSIEEGNDRSLLQTPGPNATEQEKRSHFDAAVRAAKVADALDITGCIGTPVVWKVKLGQMLKVKNRDNTDHTMDFGFGPDLVYTIPANGTKEIKPNFPKGVGLYGYGCETARGAAGLVLVTE